jgi:glycosyltransferase involved in cell wall biosynthesis
MRILHTEASCGWGGQELRILTESQGLKERGWQITIACPPHATIAAQAPRFGIPVVPLPIEAKRLPGLTAMRRLIATDAFDVISTHSSTDTWLAAVACRTLGQRPGLVRTRHISAPTHSGWSNRWLYRQFDQVVCTGEALRQELIAAFGLNAGRVHSIPTGIDARRFTPGDRLVARQAIGLHPESGPVVGIVATLRSWKGHSYLIEALAQLRAHQAQWKRAILLIVGDGPQNQALHAKVRELDLQSAVRFAGNLDDVAPWLCAMDYFCLPSTANEGVPQSLIQAMQMGLPCITTEAGAITQLARHEQTALIVPMRDSSAIAQALQRLEHNPVERNALGERARALALGDYEMQGMLDRMAFVYEEAARLAGRKSR